MDKILLNRNDQQIAFQLQRAEKGLRLINEVIEVYQQKEDMPPLTEELLRSLLSRPDSIKSVWESNLEPMEINGRKISPTALAEQPDFEQMIHLLFKVRSEISLTGLGFFSFQDGEAVLSEDYRKTITDQNSQYVSSEEEHTVWNAIQKLKEAAEQFLEVSGNSHIDLNLLRTGREKDVITLYKQTKPRKNLRLQRSSHSRRSA